MNLSQLIHGILSTPPQQDPLITGINSHSMNIQPGQAFCAIKGLKHDGHDFINDAIKKGAKVIFSQRPIPHQDHHHMTYVIDANLQENYAKYVARFHQPIPSNIMAITGTNGKTSTAFFAHHMLKKLGLKSGYIGTLGMDPSYDLSKNLTTPDALSLHQGLERMAQDNISHVILEASSHGLSQHRLNGITPCAGLFTNLTHDHLDYHGTKEEYFKAKCLLFRQLLDSQSHALVNADDPHSQAIEEICQKRKIPVISFGKNGKHIKLIDLQPKHQGLKAKISVYEKTYHTHLHLMGTFQIMNALGALGLVLTQNIDVQDAIETLSHIKPVPGRMEMIEDKHKQIVVDFAHTPDALSQALKALSPHCHGKIICLYGCGGQRDATKRPLMAQAAKNKAHIRILTDDNPRNEDPDRIRNDAKAADPDVIEIPDRQKAIAHGLNLMKKGDIFLIAGKGHETHQDFGTHRRVFNDKNVVKNLLKNHGKES